MERRRRPFWTPPVLAPGGGPRPGAIHSGQCVSCIRVRNHFPVKLLCPSYGKSQDCCSGSCRPAPSVPLAPGFAFLRDASAGHLRMVAFIDADHLRGRLGRHGVGGRVLTTCWALCLGLDIHRLMISFHHPSRQVLLPLTRENRRPWPLK